MTKQTYMKRRTFIKASSLATTAIATTATACTAAATAPLSTTPSPPAFKLKYAPHFGMFKNSAGEDLIDQVNFMADQGFTAMEDNSMKDRDVAMQEKVAQAMAKRGMDMGVFVAHKIYWKEPNLASGKEDFRTEFLTQIKESVEVAKRVNAKWMTVVPGQADFRQDMGYQTNNVIETLKMACDILEPHNLTIVLEPLNFRNHPGLFLTKAAQGFQICEAVDSPSCKLLFDIYHQQIQEGNLIPNIEKSWDQIAYFQIGDNPGRKEPTTGEINYKNIFKYIHSRGFKDILGMEHGNFYKGAEGEQKLIAAYKESDSFAVD